MPILHWLTKDEAAQQDAATAFHSILVRQGACARKLPGFKLTKPMRKAR